MQVKSVSPADGSVVSNKLPNILCLKHDSSPEVLKSFISKICGNIPQPVLQILFGYC